MTLVYSNENFPIDCLQIELRYNVQPIDMCVGVMPPTSFSYIRLVAEQLVFQIVPGTHPSPVEGCICRLSWQWLLAGLIDQSVS